MKKRVLFWLVIITCASCGKHEHKQTFTIKLEGKPYNLVHIFEHDVGNLDWEYEGNVSGKVGVCLSGCDIISEEGFVQNCDKGDTLSGKFKKKSLFSGIEGVLKGSQRCFVFVPEDKEAIGEIKITFIESTFGFR